jgi:hypothetical protein
MADYFLIHDGRAFEAEVRPCLGAAWRARSFAPCRALCERLLPAAGDYARRYHTGVEPLLACAARGELPFERAIWRALAGEVLLFGAALVPEIAADARTLCWLLAPGAATNPGERRGLAPIQQALRGSRDLTFGPAVYRPEHAGYNDAGDVARLADYLAGVDPGRWRPADLEGLGVGDEEDQAEEVEFAREWFPELVGLYARARSAGQVVVLEEIY